MSAILKFSNETHICACIHLLCIMGIYEYIHIIIKKFKRAVRSAMRKTGKRKRLKPWLTGNSQAVQWLGLHAFTADDSGLIPIRGPKIPQALRLKKCKIKIKNHDGERHFLWEQDREAVGMSKMFMETVAFELSFKGVTALTAARGGGNSRQRHGMTDKQRHWDTEAPGVLPARETRRREVFIPFQLKD